MPGVIVDAAVNVTLPEVELAPLRLVGEKEAVKPIGSPEADSAMGGTAPFETALDTVMWFELPVKTVSEVWPALNVKLGVGMTSETVAL